MLKKVLFEELDSKENDLSNYKFERDNQEFNAVIHVRTDAETPIIRLDAIVDYNALKLYEILKSNDIIQQWFSDRCLVSRLVEQLHSGSEIYCLILSFPPPLNQLVIYYKRFVKEDAT